MKAEKCPVCNGVGLVSGGFYSRPGDCEAWVASEMMETCRACGGKGWVEVSEELGSLVSTDYPFTAIVPGVPYREPNTTG